MKYNKIECKSCGADLKVNIKIKTGYCVYCGTQYIVLDEKTVHVHKYKKLKFTPLKAVFWAALLVVVILSVTIPLVLLNKEPPPVPEPETPYVYEDSRAYKFAGNYLVGTDIEPGEYVIYCDPLEKYAQVYINKTQSAGSNTANNLFYRTPSYRIFVKVNEGQYLRVVNGNIFKPGVIKIEQSEDGGYPLGIQLKVGLDIPAGEYIIWDKEEKISYNLYREWNESPLTSYVDVYNRRYIKLTDGQYISSSGGKIYPLNKAPAFFKNENGEYLPGQYKVGVDIEEGTYQVVYPPETKYLYYGILFDSPFFTYEQLEHIYLGVSNPKTSFELKASNNDGNKTYDSCYVYVHNDTTLKKLG